LSVTAKTPQQGRQQKQRHAAAGTPETVGMSTTSKFSGKPRKKLFFIQRKLRENIHNLHPCFFIVEVGGIFSFGILRESAKL
jgi:hypothetical protein